MRMRRVTLTTTAAALAATLSLALAPSALAVHSTPESWQAMTAQINGGKVSAALVVPQKSEIRVRLHDGTHFTASYPAGGEQSAISDLRAHGATVTIHKAAKKSSGHIRYRYIALAILALGALAALGYYLLRGRPTSGAPAAGGPPPEAAAPPAEPTSTPGAATRDDAPPPPPGDVPR